jgi:hypothetical protein
MSTPYFSLVFAILCSGCTLLFAAPELKPPPETPGPREIDFSPITVKEDGRYKLKVTVYAGDQSYRQTFDMSARSSAVSVREFVLANLKQCGWDVTADGETKLVITGRNKEPVTRCTVTAEKLEAASVPTVRSIKK